MGCERARTSRAKAVSQRAIRFCGDARLCGRSSETDQQPGVKLVANIAGGSVAPRKMLRRSMEPKSRDCVLTSPARQDTEAPAPANSIDFEIVVIHCEDGEQRLALRQVDQRGVRETHRAIVVLRHQRFEIGLRQPAALTLAQNCGTCRNSGHCGSRRGVVDRSAQGPRHCGRAWPVRHHDRAA